MTDTSRRGIYMERTLEAYDWKRIDDTIAGLGHKAELDADKIIIGYGCAVMDLFSTRDAGEVVNYMRRELGIEKEVGK